MNIAMSYERPGAPDDGTPELTAVESSPSQAPPRVERIYVAHYRDVFRYVLAFTRSSTDAEEIVAEVFERAVRAGALYPPDPPLPWLLLTARRIATDRWRRTRRLTGILARRSKEGSSDETGQQIEFWIWFDAVSRVLSDRQREVLILRYQKDLTDLDVGSIMGISESGVRSLVARALDALRSHPEVL